VEAATVSFTAAPAQPSLAVSRRYPAVAPPATSASVQIAVAANHTRRERRCRSTETTMDSSPDL
jgi:hypothetical protein